LGSGSTAFTLVLLPPASEQLLDVLSASCALLGPIAGGFANAFQEAL